MKNAGIYVLTNTVNSKQYVGLDSNLPRRANQHLRGNSRCRAIHNAIKKHGKDNFTVEIIRYPHVSHQILCWFERSHIAERNTKSPHGYNLTDGGDGGLNPSAETREKMSAWQRGENSPRGFLGKKHSAETREKMSAWQRGKPKSAETLAKMRGKTLSAETKAKIGKANRGKKRTAETKAKMSANHRGMRGKKHTAETREKISKVKRQRNLNKRGQGTLF